MKYNKFKELFQIVALLLVLAVVGVQLALSVDAVKQRKASSKQRNEIICILKILPADRQSHPERVEACR